MAPQPQLLLSSRRAGGPSRNHLLNPPAQPRSGPQRPRPARSAFLVVLPPRQHLSSFGVRALYFRKLHQSPGAVQRLLGHRVTHRSSQWKRRRLTPHNGSQFLISARLASIERLRGRPGPFTPATLLRILGVPQAVQPLSQSKTPPLKSMERQATATGDTLGQPRSVQATAAGQSKGGLEGRYRGKNK